ERAQPGHPRRRPGPYGPGDRPGAVRPLRRPARGRPEAAADPRPARRDAPAAGRVPRPPVRRPRRAAGRPDPGRHHRADQGGRPVRHRARRGVLHLRDADRGRRDQAALPGQGLDGPGAAPAAGAAGLAVLGHLGPHPEPQPLPHGRRARRAPEDRRGGGAGGPGVGERVHRGLDRGLRRRGRAVRRRHPRRRGPLTGGRGVPRVDQAAAGLAAAPRAPDPHAALLRQPDPVPDRRGAGHLPDARVPAAGPDAGAAAGAAHPGRL
ncbi:MAG: RNA polymerase sigma factor SigB, partial [uncultured Corynebacteriales bacterium]